MAAVEIGKYNDLPTNDSLVVTVRCGVKLLTRTNAHSQACYVIYNYTSTYLRAYIYCMIHAGASDQMDQTGNISCLSFKSRRNV